MSGALRPLAATLALLAAGCPTRSPEPATESDGGAGADRPRIILFIGDGMGPVQEEVASYFAHGVPDGLTIDELPVRGQILTASSSGLTDSAASATTIATGALTYNGRIAVDLAGEPVETVVELAHSLGLSAGVVTTSSLPHATPAAFTAHESSRGRMRAIAEDQVREVRPEVMLGGGATYFAADPEAGSPDLVEELVAEGYLAIESGEELAALDPRTTDRLFGAFAGGHLPYVRARGESGQVPSLEEMTLSALQILDRDPDGFFLMVEGARIDHAGHGNRLEDIIAETLELDRAVAAARAWAAGKGGVTLIVTADHETGGLELLAPGAAGEVPAVSWRWGSHTNRRVGVYAEGPATAELDGAIADHRLIHAAVVAAITGAEPEPPPRVAVATGHTADLRTLVANQSVDSNFADLGALDALRIDADARGLTVGVEGVYSWSGSALVVLVDRDFGAGTGAAALRRVPSPDESPTIELLARLALDGRGVAGFGAEYAAVSIGGSISQINRPLGDAGWHRLAHAGHPDPEPAGAAVINYDDGVREGFAHSFSGAELHIPWGRIYPGGAIPPGAVLAAAAVLVSGDGAAVSNQALPPLSGDAELGGVAVIELDADGDGAVDESPSADVAQ